jgi:hypothetical protein
MHARLAAAALVALLFGPAFAGAAQAPNPNPENPSQTFRYAVHQNGKDYNVSVDYDFRQAWVGNTHLNLNITVETIGTQTLDLIGCEKSENSILSCDIKPELEEFGTPSMNNTWKRVYRLTASIKTDVDPQQYNVALRFRPAQGEDSLVYFPLFVGVRENGRLVVKEITKPKPELCTSGRTHSFELILHNGFHEYDVNVQRLLVSSEPGGLVSGIVGVKRSSGAIDQVAPDKPLTVLFNTPLDIASAQDELLTVDLKMVGMSYTNLISGFGDDAHINFKFLYDDGLGRVVSDYSYSRPLRLEPSPTVLVFSIILGIAGGIFIMSVWKMLKFEGALKHKVSVVVSTVSIGLIVSILALEGELNISAFNLRASYDKPVVLFLLSLFATVSGTPLLKKFFGLDKAADGASPAHP